MARIRQVLKEAKDGAVWGSLGGAVFATILLVTSALTGETYIPKWRMSVLVASLVYIVGLGASGTIAGALSPFALSRIRAYAIGVISALPFTAVAFMPYGGPNKPLSDYVLAALIWSGIVGGAVGLVMYSVRSDS